MSSIISLSSIALAAGAMLGLGLAIVIAGLVPHPTPLMVALGQWDETFDLAGHGADREEAAALMSPDGGAWETMAARAWQHWHLPISQSARRRLALEGRSLGDFMVSKVALAAGGLLTPVFVGAFAWALGLIQAPWPAGLGVVGLVVGYVVPDIQLARRAQVWTQCGGDSISAYFDLVALVRLGNASAVQSLQEAAELCDAPVFGHIRDALNRARLQQRPPWAQLRALATRLELPELSDLAEIMALDDQGASLAEALRARVRELRQAHLAASRLAAQKRIEAMTVWMVVPVLVFALIFLIPPIMTMVAA